MPTPSASLPTTICLRERLLPSQPREPTSGRRWLVSVPKRVALLVLGMALLSCPLPPTPPPGPPTPPPPPDPPPANRTLTVVVGRAPDSLASKPLRDTGQSGSPVTAF